MKKDYSITKHFGANLAELLSEKILSVDKNFDSNCYIRTIKKQCTEKTYTQRIDLHATELRKFLPKEYKTAVKTLVQILGNENENETGMFTNYYWVMPIGNIH